MISIDTNVLVYAADEQAGVRHVAAKDIMRAARDAPVALTDQSLIEFINVTTRKVKLPFEVVAPYVRELLDSFKVLLPAESIVEDVLALLSRHKMSVFDARIVAICASHGCDYLLSEDLQDGARYSSVTVLNPFNVKNTPLINRLFVS